MLETPERARVLELLTGGESERGVASGEIAGRAEGVSRETVEAREVWDVWEGEEVSGGLFWDFEIIGTKPVSWSSTGREVSDFLSANGLRMGGKG